MRALETPQPLLEAIEKHARAVKAPRRSQIVALRELFSIFTTDRRRLNRFQYLDDPRMRLAYLRYHTPLNTVRSMCVLRDLVDRYPDVSKLDHIADLGAGPGSSSLATLLTFDDDRERNYLLTDRSAKAIQLAREVFGYCSESAKRPAGKVTAFAQKLPALPDFHGPTLLWLSMVLNEIAPSERSGIDLNRFFASLAAKLPTGSVVAIVEPAQRSPALRLLELHDRLLESPAWEVLGPCTHQASCPLLRESKRPWCHFHFKWKAGKFVEEAAKPLGLQYEDSSFSYLALRRVDESIQRLDPSPELARVIGDAMPVRGGQTGRYICRDGGRRIAKRLPKEASRGDLIRVDANAKSETVVRSWP